MIRAEGATFVELDDQIARMDAAMDTARGRVMRAVAAELGRVRIAAAMPPEMPAEPVSDEPGESVVSLDTLGVIVTLWAIEVDGGLFELVSEVFTYGARALAAGAVGARARRELSAEIDEVLTTPLAQEYLINARNRMVRFSDDMWEVARAQLLEGFIEGESIDQLRDRLVEVVDFTEARARTVARTEVVSASNAGSLALVELAGFTGTKTWLATPDARTRPTHVLADGQVVSIDDAFEVGGSSLGWPGDPTGEPEEIINCVPGDTLIQSLGDLRRIYRRWYEGVIFRVNTASGVEFTGTPNHPVLTDSGWKALKDVDLSDKLVAASLTEGVSGSQPEIDNMPTKISEIYRAAHQSGVTHGVKGASVDFHGDGRNGKVEIVTIDGNLPGPFGKHERQFILAAPGGTKSTGARCGATQGALLTSGSERRHRVDPLPEGRVGGLGHLASFSNGSAGHSLGHGVASPTDRYASLYETQPYGVTRDAEIFGKRLLGLASGVPADNLCGGEFTPPACGFRSSGSIDARLPEAAPNSHGGCFHLRSDTLKRQSLTAKLDQVIDIQQDLFSSHVYNLETSTGAYIGNGITHGNCRCTLTYELDDELDDDALTAAGGTMGTGAWVGVLTVEGRPTGDRRMFTPGALTWQELPLPLLWQRQTDDGHKGSVIVGRVDEIARVGDLIVGRGTFDLDTPEGCDAYGRMMRGYLSGTSIDTDNYVAIDVEYIYGPGLDADGEPVIDMVVLHSARLRGATLVAIPAFIEAKIGPASEDVMPVDPEPEAGPIPRPRPAVPYTDFTKGRYAVIKDKDRNVTVRPMDSWDVLTAAAIGAHDTPTIDEPWDSDAQITRLASPMPVETARHMYAWMDDERVEDGEIVKDALSFPHHEVSEGGTPGAANLVACSAGIAALHGARGGTKIPEADRRGVYDHLAAHLRDGGRVPPPFDGDTESMTAAAYVLTIPDVPPAEWFAEPRDVPIEGALTVTDEGRVYGYLAPAGVAHRSFQRRVTVPMGNVDYSLYMGRETIAAGGVRVVTGALTMDCGHAAHTIQSSAAALDHYDNACSIVATVRIGESSGGVWVAGALVPGVSASQVSRMMACQLSGDWRPHRERNGWREFAGALLVPVPGFAMPRVSPSVRVQEGALVASAVPVRYVDTSPLIAADCGCAPEVETVAPDLSNVASLIAHSVGLDFASRAEAIRASVDQ